LSGAPVFLMYRVRSLGYSLGHQRKTGPPSGRPALACTFVARVGETPLRVVHAVQAAAGCGRSSVEGVLETQPLKRTLTRITVNHWITSFRNGPVQPPPGDTPGRRTLTPGPSPEDRRDSRKERREPRHSLDRAEARPSSGTFVITEYGRTWREGSENCSLGLQNVGARVCSETPCFLAAAAIRCDAARVGAVSEC
jgi:hypothetical protein